MCVDVSACTCVQVWGQQLEPLLCVTSLAPSSNPVGDRDAATSPLC